MQFWMESHAVAFGLQWSGYGLLLMPQAATRAHVGSIPRQPRVGVGKGARGGEGRRRGGESMWGAGFSAMPTCLQSGVMSLVQGCLLLLVSIQAGG